jgi:tetratricopeptide (TPR) repeat protein
LTGTDRRVTDVNTTSEGAGGSGPAGEGRGRGWRGPAAVVAGVAVVALLLAAESLEATTILDVTLHVPGIDKVAHVGQYAIVFLIVWWLVGRLALRPAPRAIVAAVIAFLLGAGDELFQRVVASRTFEIADLAANGVGVLLGIGLGPVLPSRRLARGAVAVAVCGLVALATHSYFGLRHFNRGVLYSRAGDLPKALEQYRLALRDGIDTPTFYNELAWIEVESGVGDVQAAVGYSARALQADPRNPDVLDTYGWALHRAGRSREALPHLERALAGKPRMFCIHYHLGEVYGALGDHARAERHLREQIRRFPGGSEARRAEASLRRRGVAMAAPAAAPVGL